MKNSDTLMKELFLKNTKIKTFKYVREMARVRREIVFVCCILSGKKRRIVLNRLGKSKHLIYVFFIVFFKGFIIYKRLYVYQSY